MLLVDAMRQPWSKALLNWVGQPSHSSFATPRCRWLLEDQSTSTRTNALYSLAIIQRQQQQQRSIGNQAWRSIVLVTNPFHQWRSYHTFKRALQQMGMNVTSVGPGPSYKLYVAAAPFAGHRGYGCGVLDLLADYWDFFREIAAISWYGLRGWL